MGIGRGVWWLASLAVLVAQAAGAAPAETSRASVDSFGVEGNAGSLAPAISGNGRFVAFESGASNLAPPDTNGFTDIFVRDLVLNATTKVSVGLAGAAPDQASGSPSISGDGRFVAFRSSATNLVAGDTNGAADVFVRGSGSQPVPVLGFAARWILMASLTLLGSRRTRGALRRRRRETGRPGPSWATVTAAGPPISRATRSSA